MTDMHSKTAALEAWLRAHGGYLHSALSIAHTAVSGLHWRALSPVSPGTRLITVPHALTISYLNALVDDGFPVFRQQRHCFKIEAMGFFYLMAQYINRDISFWKPYLDLLPSPESDLTTPLWFREQDDLAWLEGTDVLHTAKGRMEVYEQYYASGVEVLKQAGIDTCPYTWDLFLWAVTMFTSRSFSSNSVRPHDSKYWAAYKSSADSSRRQAALLDMSHTPAEDLDFSVLFPVLDAGNHKLETKVDWTFDPGRFSVTSLEAYEAGAEVHNNYGIWKGNSELLLGYGFCIQENPNDTVMLTLKPPSSDLQADLRTVHPGYFHPSGEWAGEKATFHIQSPVLSADAESKDHVFTSLPEPLLELLIYMLHHERGLPFTLIEQPHQYLLSPDLQSGSKYKPFLARAMVQSLAPKLAKLQSTTLLASPSNHKQVTAAIYRQSQIQILDLNIGALKAYTRSLLQPPSAPGPHVVTLEGLLGFFAHHAINPQSHMVFLRGISASAGSVPLAILRQSGWEEDLFVLLLCAMLLDALPAAAIHTLTPPPILPSWVSLSPSQILSLLNSSSSNPDPAPADDLMEIVHAAAAVTTPASSEPPSLWTDPRWSAALIASFGGAMVQSQSFLMAIPDKQGRDEVRTVVYVHGP